MNVHDLETQLLVQIFLAFIAIVPVAATAIIAYLQTMRNKVAIEQRPTHIQMSSEVTKQVQSYLNNGNGEQTNVKGE